MLDVKYPITDRWGNKRTLLDLVRADSVSGADMHSLKVQAKRLRRELIALQACLNELEGLDDQVLYFFTDF